MGSDLPIDIKRCKGSKSAKVVTARRLLGIVYRVLKERDSFKEYKKNLSNNLYFDRLKIAESPSISHSVCIRQSTRLRLRGSGNIR